jgi:polar amino acid transport system ATP-binding protein
MAFLELNAVEKSYGDHMVLRGLDLHVEKHEVVCLIGASGCGKSTLLRDVNALRRSVGIVFQSFNLFPHMSVLQNIELAPTQVLGTPRSEARERAMSLLARVGLDGKANAYPDQLSGGQQQRVAIVRALAMDPEVLLLDEITSALDPELVAEVLSIVRELAESGLTILMATHEMSFARDVANRVAFVHEGIVLEEGPASRIFENPHEERTRAFLDKIIAAGRL